MEVKERRPYRSLTSRRDTERRYTSSSADSEDGKINPKSYSSSETLKAFDQDSRLAYGSRVKDVVHHEVDEFCRQGKGQSHFCSHKHEIDSVIGDGIRYRCWILYIKFLALENFLLYIYLYFYISLMAIHITVVFFISDSEQKYLMNIWCDLPLSLKWYQFAYWYTSSDRIFHYKALHGLLTWKTCNNRESAL